jgi:hypothetical protein
MARKLFRKVALEQHLKVARGKGSEVTLPTLTHVPLAPVNSLIRLLGPSQHLRMIRRRYFHRK